MSPGMGSECGGGITGESVTISWFASLISSGAMFSLIMT